MSGRHPVAAGIARAALSLVVSATAVAAPVEPWSLQTAIGNPAVFMASGSVRARYESLNGQFRPGRGSHDQAFSLRTTLAVGYRAPWFRIDAELNDSRVYADDADSTVTPNEVNTFELVQANLGADFGAVLGARSMLSAKLGRYTLDLGSRRLVARNDFRNTTNAFTGVQLHWTDAAHRKATLFYSLPIRRLPDGAAALRDNDTARDEEDFNTVFWGGEVEVPVPALRAALETYVLGLDEDDAAGRATRNRKLYTVGGRVFRPAMRAAWDYEIEGAYQFGEARTGTAAGAPTVDVSAFFVHAQGAYTFAAPWQPRIGLAYDRASGDKPGSASDNRFDTLFGARRWEYGPTGIYGPIGRANLSSVDARVDVRPTPRWEALVGWRANWLESRSDAFSSTGVRDSSGASGDFAGHQIETRLRWWLVPMRVRLEAGGAVFVNGGFLDDAPNASGHGNTLYGYSMVTTTF